jgi:hypothetical protein
MNKKMTLWLLTALLLAVALSGCNVIGNVPGNGIDGSGVIVSREYDFSDFSEIEVSQAFQATITRGDTYSVVVRIDDNLVDRLLVEQDGNRVSIGLVQDTLLGQATLEADVTLPALTRLNAAGAASAQLNGFAAADDFAAEASGASRIHGDIAAGNVTLRATGASTISLAGEGHAVAADASGASTIDLEEFAAVDANVVANGASSITVNLTGRLDAEASGASNVFYLGSPTLGNINTNGASTVEQR